MRQIAHITEETGASSDTDYLVTIRCIPNCPACVQRETAAEMVDEIEDFTCEHINSDGDYIFAAKGDVFIYQIDWQTLKSKYLGG